LACAGCGGNLYIADTNNNRIRMVDASAGDQHGGRQRSARFSGDGGAATLARLSLPRGVALDAATNLYIADWNNNRIRRVDADTGDDQYGRR
jgi:trimeric autotransporter adhesin